MPCATAYRTWNYAKAWLQTSSVSTSNSERARSMVSVTPSPSTSTHFSGGRA